MKRTLASIVVLAAAAGCASPSPAPQMDGSFGDAVKRNVAAQTLDPAAGRNAPPLTGIDGKSGALAMERYHDSFKAPPKTFNVINIGGAIGGN